MCKLVVVQIKSPQETDRFSHQDVGHKQLLLTYWDSCTTSLDGKATHRLPHIDLDFILFETHLDW